MWLEDARAKSQEEGASDVSVEAFAAIEKEIEESKEKGETVKVYGKRMMESNK